MEDMTDGMPVGVADGTELTDGPANSLQRDQPPKLINVGARTREIQAAMEARAGAIEGQLSAGLDELHRALAAMRTQRAADEEAHAARLAEIQAMSERALAEAQSKFAITVENALTDLKAVEDRITAIETRIINRITPIEEALMDDGEAAPAAPAHAPNTAAPKPVSTHVVPAAAQRVIETAPREVRFSIEELRIMAREFYKLWKAGQINMPGISQTEVMPNPAAEPARTYYEGPQFFSGEQIGNIDFRLVWQEQFANLVLLILQQQNKLVIEPGPGFGGVIFEKAEDAEAFITEQAKEHWTVRMRDAKEREQRALGKI